MQSKYKVGLLRLNLLVAAGFLAIQAFTATRLSDAVLLWLATAWLAVTATQLEFSHRRPATVPWQLLPGLLLAALLWAEPGRHVTWLWAWAILLMLPQPRWMLLLDGLLAVLTWGSLRELLGSEQWSLAGLLLAGLMLLGLSRSLELQALRSRVRHRARLIPGLPLWPGHQLAADLKREAARARREGVHAELLLLRSPKQQLWPLAEQLCRLIHRFESCYRLDRQTLAVLLTSRDAEQAAQRRNRLLSALQPATTTRAIALSRLASLDEECRALADQAESRVVKEVTNDG